MGDAHTTLNEEIRDWLEQQKIFFVATAPTSLEGRINCSPKGGDTFRILDNRTVAYLDLTGSGIETTAHVQENGRVVLMFCAFTGPPKIVRLHGTGEVIYPGHPEFVGLSPLFPARPGARAIIRVTLSRVADSCGHGVPLFDFVAQRDLLDQWSEKKGVDGLSEYRRKKNQVSIDGIPGYKEG